MPICVSVEASLAAAAIALADSEIGDDRVALVQQDILGFDIAMDDVMAVGVVESVATSVAIRTANSTGRCPSSARRSRTVWPSITGITKKRKPSASPESWSGRMWGD